MDVTYTLTCEPEFMPIRGNASAWDDEEDEKYAQWIEEQLENGNEWAWCIVYVTADFDGLTGFSSLGGCCYAGAEDFKASGGYYDDMKAEALANLKTRIDAARKTIAAWDALAPA